jgi:hypothetical protein
MAEDGPRYHHEFPQLPDGTTWGLGDQFYSDAPPATEEERQQRERVAAQFQRALAMLPPPSALGMLPMETLLDMSIVEEHPEMRAVFPEAAALVDRQRQENACPVCGEQVTRREVHQGNERGAGVLLLHGEGAPCWVPEEEAHRG